MGAFNDEMGLQAVDNLTAAGPRANAWSRPPGWCSTGEIDQVKRSLVSSPAEDDDRDGVVNEIPQSLVDFMEFYLFNYFKPGQYRHTNTGQIGQNLLAEIGCTSCHIPNLVINRDRRVADVETNYDPVNGIFNRLFSVASLLVTRTMTAPGIRPSRSRTAIRSWCATSTPT